MTIDIRAKIICNLGPVISGSLSDSYIQESGLIFCSGSVELSGLYTPKAGDPVTFNYIKDEITRSIPRKLRVLSSFADPFRNITKVELGCKLTYLNDLKPTPTVEGDSPIETGRRQQCANGYIDYPANSTYGTPIFAAFLMQSCLTKLEISASSIPLTNRFYIDSFDLSPGYVQVLGDLLLSESYCGYLDENEVLQVFSLDQKGGSGPVFDKNKLIDIDSIGFGDRPADAVIVRYDSLQLSDDLENEQNQQVISSRNWEFESTENAPQQIEVRYATGTRIYTFSPYTETITQYGEDLSFPEDVCVIAGSDGPDLSDSPISRTTTRNIIRAEGATDYCAKLLSNNLDPGGELIGAITTTETYEYDDDGQLVRQVTTTTEPFFAWVGRLNLDVVFSANDYLVLGTTPVMVRQVVVDIETLYARLPTFIKLDPGETYNRVVSGQKVVTTTYENIAISQRGENGVAGIRENAPFGNATEALYYLLNVSNKMILTDQEVKTSQNRILIGIERRPPKEIRFAGEGRVENTNELLYVSGSPSDASRVIEFSMPYQDDDVYASSGAIFRGSAKAKASRYGRCQNKLLLGNRYGMNIQLAPEDLPGAPFSAYVVSAEGYEVLYRTNGTSWQMDSTGLLVSTEGLYWGAIGGVGDGQFWFPVAPGIETLPTSPEVVNGEMTVDVTVPIQNEIVPLIARTSTKLVVKSLAYSLNISTELLVTTKTKLVLPPATSVVSPTTSITVSATAPVIVTDSSLNVPMSVISVAAPTPSVNPVTPPTFVASGAFGLSPSSQTYAIPAGYQANDIAILAFKTFHTDLEPTPVSGWAKVPDTAVYAISSKLEVWWKRLGASETNPTVPDVGDHQIGFISVFRGCKTTGDPWDVTTTNFARNNANPASLPGVTTTVDGTLLVMFITHSLDSNTVLFSNPQNSNLSSLVIQTQVSSGVGTGGGLALIKGEKQFAGSTGVTQVTLSTASENCFAVIALRA